MKSLCYLEQGRPLTLTLSLTNSNVNAYVPWIHLKGEWSHLSTPHETMISSSGLCLRSPFVSQYVRQKASSFMWRWHSLDMCGKEDKRHDWKETAHTHISVDDLTIVSVSGLHLCEIVWTISKGENQRRNHYRKRRGRKKIPLSLGHFCSSTSNLQALAATCIALSTWTNIRWQLNQQYNLNVVKRWPTTAADLRIITSGMCWHFSQYPSALWFQPLSCWGSWPTLLQTRPSCP